MKILIISDYDSTYYWTIKEINGEDIKEINGEDIKEINEEDNSEEFRNVDMLYFFDVLENIIDGSSDSFEYFKHEHHTEFNLAMNTLDKYDKVILCRNGNILIHSKENK